MLPVKIIIVKDDEKLLINVKVGTHLWVNQFSQPSFVLIILMLQQFV